MPTYEKLILPLLGVTGRLGPGSAGGGEEPDDDGGGDVDRNGGGEGGSTAFA